MTNRITFLLLLLFWLTMSYLLWRTEYVGTNQTGTSVPLEVVWRKIITSPDPSSLEVLHNGRKVGYCRWSSNIGQELASGKVLTDEISADAMSRPPGSYRLNFDGNVVLKDAATRLGFESELEMTSSQAWQQFSARLKMRPLVWEIRSVASEQSVRLITGDRQGKTEQVFKFSDLQNPQALMEEFDLPSALALAGVLGPLTHPQKGNLLAAGLDWKARNDWITIGHTSVRAYRVEASLLERYRMKVVISRAGEILHVELPDGWELVNDHLIGL